MARPHWTPSRSAFELSIWLTGITQKRLGDIHKRLKYEHAIRYIYRPRPDDIFIVTFPKSGTTLMQMMLYQLTSDGSMDIPHINSVAPWFENQLSRGNGPVLEKLPSPRFFKSHLLHQHMPRQGKFIYVARDARDVTVSAYHHHCLMSGKQPKLEDFVNDFLRDGTPFDSWFGHIASWWPHRNDPNVLFLRYEEIIPDLPGTARKVSRFWGLPVSEENILRVVERCGFAFMKQHNSKFDPRLEQQAGVEVMKFIRKGIRGDGKSVFNPQQNRQLARRMEKLARQLECSDTDPLGPLLRPDLSAQPVEGVQSSQVEAAD